MLCYSLLPTPLPSASSYAYTEELSESSPELKAVMTLDHGERDRASGTSSAAARCVTEAGHLISLDSHFLFCK